MKYIRTKDGIYEVEEWFKPLENDMVYIPNEGLNKILNQADTIEDLCELYIVVANGFPFQFINKPTQIFFKWFEDKHLNIEKIYGAIRTEWGLKYVAKMNEIGELELL